MTCNSFCYLNYRGVRVMVFNATFNDISAISWWFYITLTNLQVQRGKPRFHWRWILRDMSLTAIFNSVLIRVIFTWYPFQQRARNDICISFCKNDIMNIMWSIGVFKRQSPIFQIRWCMSVYQDKNIKMPQEAETHTCISCPPWPMFNSVIFPNSEQFKNNVLLSTKKSLKIPNG